MDFTPPPLGNPKAALGLAGAAFIWGLAKNAIYSHHFASRENPFVVASGISAVTTPAHLLDSIVVGPAEEELIYRGALQQMVGIVPASIMFGLAHASRGVSTGDTVFRVVDACLGGFLYGKAFEQGGLSAAWACHASHNLGSSMGASAGARSGLARNPQLPQAQAAVMDWVRRRRRVGASG